MKKRPAPFGAGLFFRALAASSGASRSAANCGTEGALPHSRDRAPTVAEGDVMKNRVLAAVAAVGMLGVVATPAEAQINYYTQGWFTSADASCNGAAPAAGAPVSSTCTTPAYTLTYSAKAANPGLIGSGSVVSLGNFALTVT